MTCRKRTYTHNIHTRYTYKPHTRSVIDMTHGPLKQLKEDLVVRNGSQNTTR